MGEDNNSSHDIPLVKLDLHNVTYRPKTKTYGKANSNKAYSFKKSDGPSNDDTSTSKPVLRKTILNNVTPPSIEPYKLQAWMGPSGSGKTTLLSIAAGMTAYDSDSFSDESRITINNDKENMFTKKGGFPKGLVGIVWQDDLLLSYLTVRETIEFAAKMKTPESEVHRVPQMVDEVLDDLGLTGVQHSLIGQSHGGPGRGISGGERKRVSVAVELVSKPSIIFLDEPTSGLDSTSAFELMLTLKKLARKGGHAIVAVIHQPRTTIFDLFDGLLLLSKGEEVYSGPANGARAVLESCPIIGSPLPEQTNVADWIMDMIMKDENRAKLNDADEESSNGRVLARHWANIKSNVENEDEASSQIEDIEGKNKYQRLVSLAEIKNSVPRYTSSFATQLRMLTRRAIKQTRGEKISNAAIITTLAYIFFESLFWFRLKDDTNSIYERNSLVFFMIIAQGNGVVISSIPTFKRDRNLLTRERQKKMYQVLPYFIAKTLADMTTTIMLPVLQVVIVYWTANLWPSAYSFFIFVFLFYLTITTAQSIGLFMSAALPSLQLALLITPALVIFLFIVGGFYIPFSKMPGWISWLKWTSFATYGYCGMLITQYAGREIPCATVVTFQIGDSGLCPLPGDEVLVSLGITGLLSKVWFNALMLVALQLFCRTSAYVMLRRSP